MGFMNQSDVKKHLSASEGDGKRLYLPVRPTDASGFVGQKLRAPSIVITPLPPTAVAEKATSSHRKAS